MIQEQIKQLEEPAVQKLKDVSGMFFMIPQSLKVITEHVTLQVFFHFLIFYIDNFLFLELVKKELFELAQSSLVGFPNLIRTAMVTSPLLLVVYLLLNTDKYVLTSSVWFSWRLKTSELNGKLKQRPYWGCSFRWSWSFTLRTQHTARC